MLSATAGTSNEALVFLCCNISLMASDTFIFLLCLLFASRINLAILVFCGSGCSHNLDGIGMSGVAIFTKHAVIYSATEHVALISRGDITVNTARVG